LFFVPSLLGMGADFKRWIRKLSSSEVTAS